MRASTLVSVVLSFVFLTPACGLLFRCGCKTLWEGAEKLCSINVGPPPPCPWCDSMALGAMGAAFAIAPVVAPCAGASPLMNGASAPSFSSTPSCSIEGPGVPLPGVG